MPKTYTTGNFWISWSESGTVTIGRHDGGTVSIPVEFLLEGVDIVRNQYYNPQFNTFVVATPTNQASPSGPVESPESSTTNTLKE